MAADDMLHFHIVTNGRDDAAVIRVAGELDIGTAPRLISMVRDLAGAGTHRIALDCDEFDFVDSAGVRALIVSRNEALQRGTSFDLVATSPAVSRVLEMTGLSSLLAAAAAG